MNEEYVRSKIAQLEAVQRSNTTPVPAELLSLSPEGEPVMAELPPPPDDQTAHATYFATNLGSVYSSPQAGMSEVYPETPSSVLSASTSHSMLVPTAITRVFNPPSDRRQLLGALKAALDQSLPNPMPGKTDFIEAFSAAWFCDDVNVMAAQVRDVVYRVHTTEGARGRSQSRARKPPLAEFETYVAACNVGSSVVLSQSWIASIYDVCNPGLILKLMTIQPSTRFPKMFRRKPRTRQDIALIVSSYVNGET